MQLVPITEPNDPLPWAYVTVGYKDKPECRFLRVAPPDGARGEALQQLDQHIDELSNAPGVLWAAYSVEIWASPDLDSVEKPRDHPKRRECLLTKVADRLNVMGTSATIDRQTQTLRDLRFHEFEVTPFDKQPVFEDGAFTIAADQSAPVLH